MEIRKAESSNATDIAKLHQLGIPTGFLSSLKIQCLDILYQFLIKHEIVFLAVENETVVGFVSVSLNTKKMYKKFIIQSSFKLLPYMMNKLFSRIFFKKILETLKAPFITNKKDKDIDKENFGDLPELLSIVVDSKVQAKGIGTMLLSEMENQLKKIGIFDYKVVVGSNLELAMKFYKKNGFELKSQFELHKGNLSNLYVKRIHEQTSLN